ncbi:MULTISPECIES: hypothetical protein [unclassified Microbacterium]|uniref:hypothetical protein n=1 Tax=unclassified Microbacterium TaxID=2609290 RepID=UPI0030188813
MGKHRPGTPRGVAADLRFERTLDELADLVRRLGVLPSAGSKEPDEVRLARWLAKRRWEANTGILPPNRATALDAAAPRWRESTHSREGFEATLAACAAWRYETGWLPRSAGGGDTETRLGAWLVARRYDARVRRMPSELEQLLDTQLPGWRFRPTPFTRVTEASASAQRTAWDIRPRSITPSRKSA